jgi:hypothetical protein
LAGYPRLAMIGISHCQVRTPEGYCKSWWNILFAVDVHPRKCPLSGGKQVWLIKILGKQQLLGCGMKSLLWIKHLLERGWNSPTRKPFLSNPNRDISGTMAIDYGVTIPIAGRTLQLFSGSWITIIHQLDDC